MGIEYFDLTKEQKETKPKTKGVQFYLSARCTEYYSLFKLKPVCYTTSRLGEFISFGIFYQEKRVDNFRCSGMGEADCYWWIATYGDQWIKDNAVDKILLGEE